MDTEEIVLCMGSSCYSRGNQQSAEGIMNFLMEKGLDKKVHFKGELCSCECKSGPNLKIGKKVFNNVDTETAITILNDHFQTILS